MNKEKDASQVPGEDKLWVALIYILTPLMPFILLTSENLKERPFIRANNVQALLWGLPFYLIVILSGPFAFILWAVGYALQLFWAYKAFRGEMVYIPIITDFVRNRGWS